VKREMNKKNCYNCEFYDRGYCKMTKTWVKKPKKTGCPTHSSGRMSSYEIARFDDWTDDPSEEYWNEL